MLSPLLSNIYLNPLDHLMTESGYEMVRYADDFVILCRDKEEAAMALEAVADWMEKAGLTLHPTKTRARVCQSVNWASVDGLILLRGERKLTRLSQFAVVFDYFEV